ncbi:MAG: hypothetical protein JWQ38_2776 [Flavipsychrobacter sp.]|nr:hypothetical protein [Flavipsychrobacter sp.]
MKTKHFYYYIPKVILVSIIMLVILSGLGYAISSTSDISTRIVVTSIFILVLLISYFLVVDAIIPVLKKKAVLIIDDNGITDIISWGLIKWSNINELKAAEVESQNRGARYKFSEMRISLKDINDYECYATSRWIRIKIKWIKIYRGGNADIIIDIDALDGNVADVFNQINAYYNHYKSP